MHKTLHHRMPVKLTAWADNITAEIFTVAGYAIERGRDPTEAVKRAQDNCHELAGSIYIGGTLVGDRADGQRRLAEARQRNRDAMLLEEGETVEIEGALYVVKIVPGNAGRFPRNSDPIKFRPV